MSKITIFQAENLPSFEKIKTPGKSKKYILKNIIRKFDVERSIKKGGKI